jgi:hypothetical protein
MHVNSIVAYWEGRQEAFSKRELAVLGVFARLQVASDREIMLALGFVDMNSVRPRISELLKEGLLVEVGQQPDPITGKIVRLVAVAMDPRKAQRQFEFVEEKSA